MDAISNPYSPGAGLRPPLLAGRQSEVDAFDAVLRRGELGRVSQGIMLTGLRGVGKTVLLNEMAARAEESRWITVQLEVRPGGATAALSSLASALNMAIRRQQGPKLSEIARRALSSITGFSITVDPSGTLSGSIEGSVDADALRSGDLETDFASLAVDVGQAALEAGIGAAIFIDELQELDKPSMASLAAAVHLAGQRSVPFIVVGAGLPNLPGKLAEAKSYAERLFDYRQLGKLPGSTAAQALAGPGSDAGVTWLDEALAATINAADGYPYFLQEFGAATWNVSAGPIITERDAANGILLGQAKLDGGFFQSRWHRATASEQTYLRAMAEDDGEDSRTPVVAARLGRTMSNVGPIRAGLIGKGLIYAPEYGRLAFTVPGMAAFIRRQIDE
jgi:AAA ATPase domain